MYKAKWWEIQISHPTFLPLLKRKIAQNTSVMALIKSDKGSTSHSTNVVLTSDMNEVRYGTTQLTSWTVPDNWLCGSRSGLSQVPVHHSSAAECIPNLCLRLQLALPFYMDYYGICGDYNEISAIYCRTCVTRPLYH